jgi:hypothetical protein
LHRKHPGDLGEDAGRRQGAFLLPVTSPAPGNIPASAGTPPAGWRPVALVQQRTPMLEYSYRVVYLPRSTSRDAARRILTDHAEHGDWELTRLRLFADGSRKATLRRQIIRAVRTPRGARPPKWGNVP